MLEIKCLGHACFLISADDGLRVLTDPYSGLLGYVLPEVTADIVLVSRNQAEHNCVESVGGQPAVIQGEGCRELNWVKIRGIPVRTPGEPHSVSTIFCWDMQAVRFCHLGALGSAPDQELLAQIGPVDVLFIPVGGGTVLTPQAAAPVLRQIPYKYAVPMQYRTPYNLRPACGLAEFLALQKNIIIPEPKNIWRLQRQELKNEPQLVVGLEYLPEENNVS
ncbi:MAG: MBL fold metallo-hydrolase [Candidatus Margulisbacteria bacterium]|jgi:L-ascorbate metabolism protein UlaG (beta-lactamase superfamily)|nr:MBL fold metallo-hydrolase [Candidatus Margulisiibacteriota bacterium]